MFCSIADRFHWTFDQIGELTYPQIAAINRYIVRYPAPYTVPVSLKT